MFDDFNNLNNWLISQANYTPFWNQNNVTGTWKPENVSLNAGKLVLKLEVAKNGAAVTAYGAEVQSTALYGYGTYKFRMRAASTASDPTQAGIVRSGMISAGFNYITDSATEIDFEFQSNLPGTVSVGHFQTINNSVHFDVPVEFQPGQTFNDYMFIWKSDRIDFYINGALVGSNTEHIPSQQAYMMFNLWPTNSNAFGGTTPQSGTYYMYVDNFEYTTSTDTPPDVSLVYPAQHFPKYGFGTGNGGSPGSSETYPFVEDVEPNSLPATTPPLGHRYGIGYMPTFDQPGWPTAEAGTVVTDNSAGDAPFVKQFFYVYASSDIYMRSGKPDNTWTSWQKITNVPPVDSGIDPLVKRLEPNSKTPADDMDNYDAFVYYMPWFQNTTNPGWPTSAGTVVTDNSAVDPRYLRQMFYSAVDETDNRIYTRGAHPTTGVWQPWVLINPTVTSVPYATRSGATAFADMSGFTNDLVAPLAPAKGMITFLMDDGYVEDYTVMYPMLSAKGFPGVVAIITNYINNPDPTRLNVAQIKTLEDAGWEVMSHTVNHPALATLTEAQVVTELAQSKATLEAQGFKVRNFVYPFGSHNDYVRKQVRNLYRSGFGVDAGVNTHPLRQFDIWRVPMGSFVNPGQDTEAYYKTWVDRAKNENVWVVFLLHTGPNVQSQAQTNIIQNVVNYIQTQGVPVVTGEQGLDVFGNAVDVGDYPTGNHTLIARNGKLVTSAVDGLVSRLTQGSFINSTSAVNYPLGMSFMVVGGGESGNGWPTAPGSVVTMKAFNVNGEAGFTRQTYYQYGNNTTWMRNWDGAAWTAWEQVWPQAAPPSLFGTTQVVNLTLPLVPANSSIVHEQPAVSVTFGDQALAHPIYGLQSGLIYNTYCKPGYICVRVQNVTAADITPIAQDWSFTPINVA